MCAGPFRNDGVAVVHRPLGQRLANMDPWTGHGATLLPDLDHHGHTHPATGPRVTGEAETRYQVGGKSWCVRRTLPATMRKRLFVRRVHRAHHLRGALRGDGMAVVQRPLGWRVPAVRGHEPGGKVTKFVTGATLMVRGGVLLVHRTGINGKSLREKDSSGGLRRPGIPDRGHAGKTNGPASRFLLPTPGCRVGANGLAARIHDHNGCGARETIAPQAARSRRQGKPCRNPSCGRYLCRRGVARMGGTSGGGPGGGRKWCG